MASLAHASSDFVNALRRGLEAYDGGNNTQAYAIFDEALDIEPDNIWALLWKGATAPSAKETKPWLEQAIKIEPNNEHALAGLQWVNELLIPEIDPSAIVTDSAAKEEAPVLADEPKMAVVAPPVEEITPPTNLREALAEAVPDVPEMPEMPDVSKIVDNPLSSATEVEAEPSWLGGDTKKESADLPDWLSGVDTSASPVDEVSDELPDWLKEEQSTTSAQPSDASSWLGEPKTEDMSASAPTASASEDLPDWLNEQTGPAPQESGNLPDWLSGDNTAETPSSDLPDWLNEGQTTDAPQISPSVDNDLPDWLKDESAAAPAIVGAVSGDLPSWLGGGDESEFQAQRAKGSLTASNEVVEAYQSGLLAYEEDRLDDATVAFQRVIRLDPAHVEAHNYLGSVFYLNGRPDDAIAALRRALELDSNHTESYLNLGLVYKETGNITEAVEMFRRYLDLAPESDSTAIYVRELIQELS